MQSPVLFICPTCKLDVTIVRESPTTGIVLGLPGTVYVREYSCGHTDRALEHSHRYQEIARARRAPRVPK